MDEVREDVRSSFRLRPWQRVKKPEEFEAAKGKGKSVNTASFTIKVVPREGPTRLGLIISKKVGNAVRRARVKRMVREVFRTRQDLFPSHVDVFVIGRSSCSVQSYQDVLREVEGARLPEIAV